MYPVQDPKASRIRGLQRNIISLWDMWRRKCLTRLTQVKIVASGNVSSCEWVPQCWQLNPEKFGRFSLHFFF